MSSEAVEQVGAPLQPVGDVVGRSVPRLDGVDKVCGAALYSDDMTLPGMLYAAVLGSPYAHARIVSCDTRAARALPGVKAVLSAADLPDRRAGLFVKDQPVLAREKVRYVGEPVAAIAATDAATARAAARLIDVEYEELEAVFDPVVALADGAPVIHERRNDYEAHFPLPEPPNGCSMTGFVEGDPDAAWAECDVVVEQEYELPAQQHMYLEPMSTLASVDGSGKLTLWSSMQGVTRIQASVAESLALPMAKVRVIAPRVGGAFGAKGDLCHQPIAAALALATRRPVKLTFTRDEDMAMMKSRHAGRVRIKTGARRDGTLLARAADVVLDGGAYSDESPGVTAFAAFFARGPYRIPNVRVVATSVYTNRLRGGAFRGFGNPQISFAAESQMDEIAARLGIDPVDLRLINAIDTGEPWLGGKSVEVGSLRACLERVRDASDWRRRRAAGARVSAGKRRGIGVAAVAHICAFLSAAASVRLNEDGSITVNTGAQDLGEGADTVLAQIAAGSLGLALEQVNYANPDSDSSPYNFQTAGSRITYTVGAAVRQAGERVREQMFRHAGEMLECASEDLELRPGGWIGIKGQPDVMLPFAAVAGRACFESGGPITGTHDWIYPAERFDPKRSLVLGVPMTEATGIFTFAAHVAEVEVDELTGKVEVLEYWAAHDVGRAINPTMVEGQIQGAIVQGLGYALVEELVWEQGRLVNPSMMDYKVFGAADVPHGIHALIIEMPEASGPFGAKGVGEIGVVAPAPAVGNAIRHATGVRLTRIPATPERVLRALIDAG
ncbi:MAG: xanthine dehydrogenase family protein molybdopterin-binding subunit [Gammaproteobacteria bacterium]|nr:xanthine dehydrogenase family protein molybdopterin-binding subunit [Gammaproteobacteria bacterium]